MFVLWSRGKLYPSSRLLICSHDTWRVQSFRDCSCIDPGNPVHHLDPCRYRVYRNRILPRSSLRHRRDTRPDNRGCRLDPYRYLPHRIHILPVLFYWHRLDTNRCNPIHRPGLYLHRVFVDVSIFGQYRMQSVTLSWSASGKNKVVTVPPTLSVSTNPPHSP